jgi:uncharacterized protein YukE
VTEIRVPAGDSHALQDFANLLALTAREISQQRAALASVSVQVRWVGPAADRFAARLAQLTGALAGAEEALSAAASTVACYAMTLADAQARIGLLSARVDELVTAGVSPSANSCEAYHAELIALLDAADIESSQLQSSAIYAARALDSLVPADEVHESRDMLLHLWRDVWQGTVDVRSAATSLQQLTLAVKALASADHDWEGLQRAIRLGPVAKLVAPVQAVQNLATLLDGHASAADRASAGIQLGDVAIGIAAGMWEVPPAALTAAAIGGGIVAGYQIYRYVSAHRDQIAAAIRGSGRLTAETGQSLGNQAAKLWTTTEHSVAGFAYRVTHPWTILRGLAVLPP